MRPQFEKVVNQPERSFRAIEYALPRFDSPWHFHPEIELTLIVESSGRRFVGDSVERFSAGDLVLLGPNLPHFWHNEGRQPHGASAHAVVVQFMPDFLGPELWKRAEFRAVERLLEKSSRGLHFTGRVAREAREKLRGLPALRGLPSVIELWTILNLLASARQARPLASNVYAPLLEARTQQRMNRVFAHLMHHHTEPLTLTQIANVAAMTPAAFSRHFKRTTGRNPSDFLNDLRIGHAARLLGETDRSITQIAGDTGYPTISNFNRRFRERFGCTPREYRRDIEYEPNAPAPKGPANR